MDWKDIAGAVGKFAPMLGLAIGGPGGAAIGAVVSSALGVENTPDAVSQALTVNPDAAVKLAEIEKDKSLGLQQLAVAAAQNALVADTAAIQAVNATMQAETKAEHWASWLWRPFVGFCFGLDLLLSSLLVLLVFGAQVFGAPGAEKAVAALPATLGSLTLVAGLATPVLGIASYFRGKAQADPANSAPVHG